MKTLLLLLITTTALSQDTLLVRRGDNITVNCDGKITTLVFVGYTDTVSSDSRIDSILSMMKEAFVAIDQQKVASSYDWRTNDAVLGKSATTRVANVTDANVLTYYNDPTKYVVQVVRVSSTNNIIFYRSKP